MRFDKNTGKTVAVACVILFSGILFSTWVLPAATEDRSDQAAVMPVTLNNPQKIIESPTIKADPSKLYPLTYGLRDPVNSSQVDETMLQAKNLFLKNVSEDVEFLFNLKIDSVIMEKYAEIWRLTPGKATVPTEPEPPQAPDSSIVSDDNPSSSSGEVGEPSDGNASEPENGDSQASDIQEPVAGEAAENNSSEPSSYEKELEAQRRQEEYEKAMTEYQLQLQEYERYLFEEQWGDAFSLDILFTDAKSTTWRVTAYGYADMVFALHCVKENIEVTPVSIFQERNLDVVDSNTLKMDNAIALFRSRIESVEDANDIYLSGGFEYAGLTVESPTSEYYWHIYGWTPEGNRMLVAGFRADSNTPVCYALVPPGDHVSDLLLKYGYDMGYYNNPAGYGY